MRVLVFLLVAAMAPALFTPPVWAADPSKLVETVITEAIEIAKTKTGADRQAAMRVVVQDNFDIPYMGRSALGAHWGQASERQQARFLAAVETVEARTYSERLGKFAEYTVTVGRATSRPSGVWIVESRLTRINSQPITIGWVVHESGKGLRIADVKVEGVSMSMMMRSDFDSCIHANFGEIEPLVLELEARASR